MLFTSLIPDRSAGQGFTYKFKAHQEDDPLNPRDSMPPPPALSLLGLAILKCQCEVKQQCGMES